MMRGHYDPDDAYHAADEQERQMERMTARPMTEGEREERIARIIFSYGCPGLSDRAWSLLMIHKRTTKTETPHPKPTELDHAFAMAGQISALLSTSAAERRMREALSRLADIADFVAQDANVGIMDEAINAARAAISRASR